MKQKRFLIVGIVRIFVTFLLHPAFAIKDIAGELSEANQNYDNMIIDEIENLRDFSSKTFLLNNGQYMFL